MDSYEEEGIVKTYEELEQKTSVGERDFKRLFIYDNKQYSFFLVINPHKKSYIKCFDEENNNSTKINSILNHVNELLKKNKVSGILNNIYEYIKKDNISFYKFKISHKSRIEAGVWNGPFRPLDMVIQSKFEDYVCSEQLVCLMVNGTSRNIKVISTVEWRNEICMSYWYIQCW